MSTQEIQTDRWRNPAIDPALKAHVLQKLDRHDKARKTRVFVLSFAATSGGAFAASFIFLFGSTTVTLAQVIAADSRTRSLTVITRRIMGPEKGGGFTVTRRILGDMIRTEASGEMYFGKGNFAYADSTKSIRYLPVFKLAVVDQPFKSYTASLKPPKITDMLKNFNAAKVENNVQWNGRTVTRFTYKAKLTNTDVDEELIVDPKTKLPIRLISMRDNRSWGDEYSYDYSKIDPSVMTPIIPEGTQTIDQREERKGIEKAILGNPSVAPVVVVSPYEVGVLVKRSELDAKNPFTVELKVGSMTTARQATRNLNMIGNLRIGTHEYGIASINDVNLDWAGLRTSDKASGELSITVGTRRKTYKISNLPVFHGGEIYSLNRTFADKFRAIHGDTFRR